jgi:CubicO group peptidase (beta-lactamase class C family)
MERVLKGLRPGIGIQGEAPVRWTLADRMAHYKVPGVSIAVIQRGRIDWTRGFGVREAGGSDPVTPETLFQAGSISKPTFALGVMRLVQEGKLALDDDVNLKLQSWQVPENRFTEREKVTLRRILSHTAGLTVHGFPGYEAGGPVPTVVQVLNGERPANTPPVQVDAVPGSISRYSGGGTTVAMLLVTDLVKKTFPDFMKETVLGPAGMARSSYQQPLPAALGPMAASGTREDGTTVKGKYHTYPEMSAAGLWTTASDLCALALELQEAYAGTSSRVIDSATFRRMLEVEKAPFGIGYAVNGAGRDLEFGHDGANEGFVASFIAFAERGLGLAVMTNSSNGGALIGEIVRSVAAEYGWPSHHPVEKTVVPKDPSALAEVAGEYALQLGAPKPVAMLVKVVDGKLMAEIAPPFAQKDEILADSETTFFLRSSGYPVLFKLDGEGKVIGVTIAGSVTGTRVR